MAKSYYVKFDVPENLVSPIYESLRVAVETGKVKRGTNEATKAIERGISKLISGTTRSCGTSSNNM